MRKGTWAGGIGALVLLSAIGCGGGGGHVVRTYDLVPAGIAESVPAGACLGIEGPVSVPASTQGFIIADTPVGIGSDSMEVGIMLDRDFVAQGGCDFDLALVDDSIVGSSSDSGPAPAGTYTFVVGCANLLDTCYFNLTWTATY